MVEPKPMKIMSKKDLLRLDEELAFKLQAEEEEERLAKEKAQQIEEVNIAWDDVQAKIKADYKLAQRLQAQEQKELTDEEKARLFVQLLEQRRKHFAAKRVEEKRNRPPTRAQQRSIITELVKEREELEHESSKKQKVEEDKESEELNQYLEIVSDDRDDVTIDATPLSIKSPTIVDYKIYQEGKKIYFQIIRANGESQIFKKTEPVNYMDNLLLHHLKTMFEHHVEDNVWKNQQGLVKVLNWKLYDSCGVHCVTCVLILRLYQNEVNDIRAERIAKSANPLALLAAAQPYSDNYYQAPKPQRSNATSSSTRPSASTRHKGKEIAKPVTPQSESVSEEDSDPEQAQRDKDMQKNLALLAKYFKRLYKPTNNNLRTSSNSRNKTEDTTPRCNNDNQSGLFGNQRTMTVAGTRETVGSPVVQQTGIQCFNCKGFGHYAKECRKPKRVKYYTYHKEKMMMCKQAEQGVPLLAEQADWLADTDEKIDEQELEAHYSFMAKIQELLPEESSSTEQPLEHRKTKPFLKQLKKANASLTQELEECKTNLDETSRALGEATSCRDSCLIALQNKQNELEKYIAFNDRTIDYDILQTKLNETLGLLARKDIDIKEGLKTKAYEISVVNQKHDELVKRSLLTKSHFEGQLKEKSKVISDLKVKEEKDIDKMIEMDKQLKFLNEIVYTRNQSIQTIHMLAPKCSTYNGRPTFANPRYLKKAQSEKPCLYEIPYDTSDLANRFGPNREETMTLANESRSKLNKDYVKPYDYTKQNSLYEIFKAPSLEYLYQLERAKEVRKTMWRKPFVRTKPNIAKNVAFLPVSKSISKSRQVFNDMTFNINQFREIVDQAWFKHTSDYFRVPTAKDMEVLIKTLLMPLSIKTQNDSFRFEHELKTKFDLLSFSRVMVSSLLWVNLFAGSEVSYGISYKQGFSD
ncbi:gag-pol polyprotein [Tanacetum coccineum]|uniref:Gag-pol polyprotein n=1 Tax=Tanacetum coccineum TaxID=301880 RepID=A0ABQ5EFA0_9ASTR